MICYSAFSTTVILKHRIQSGAEAVTCGAEWDVRLTCVSLEPAPNASPSFITHSCSRWAWPWKQRANKTTHRPSTFTVVIKSLCAIKPVLNRLDSSVHCAESLSAGGVKRCSQWCDRRCTHFLRISCFFCSSDVGSPIDFCLWSYIIFSTIPRVSPSRSDSWKHQDVPVSDLSATFINVERQQGGSERVKTYTAQATQTTGKNLHGRLEINILKMLHVQSKYKDDLTSSC